MPARRIRIHRIPCTGAAQHHASVRKRDGLSARSADINTDYNPHQKKLYQVFKLFDYGVYLLLRIVLAEREPDGDLVGVIIDRPDDMRTLLSPAGAGAAARCTNMMNIQIEQQHLGFLRLGKAY